MTPSSSRAATTSSPAARAGAWATPTGSRSMSCSSSAPTSTRAARCLRRRLRRRAVHVTVGDQLYDPKGEIACNPLPADVDPRRCLLLRGSGDGMNDVLQYSFGAYLAVPDDGLAANGKAFDSAGTRRAAPGPDLGAQRRAEREEPGRHVLVPRNQRDPPDLGFPAVRELAVVAVDQAGRSVRAAHRHAVRVLADRRRDVQAANAGGARACRRWTLSFWTSYDTEAAWDHLFVEARTPGGTTGRPCLTSTVTPRRRPGTAARRAGWNCIRSSPTTRRWCHHQPRMATRRARQRARPGRGTPRQATPAAGSSGASTCRRGQASRSRSRSRTPATGQSRASAPSSTTSPIPVARPSRLRAASAAGSSRLLHRAALPTPTPGHAPTPSGFPVGNSITTPDTVILGFGIEGVTTADKRTAIMGALMDHLLN